jgi:hypothetical protein
VYSVGVSRRLGVPAPTDGAKSIEFRVDGHEVSRNLALEDKEILLPRQP